MKLNFTGKNALVETVVSKTLYRELRNRVITPLTVQLNFYTHFVNDVLEWKEIYSLPFRTTLDTKLREFQSSKHVQYTRIDSSRLRALTTRLTGSLVASGSGYCVYRK